MPDTVSITWSRPSKNETITITIPEALVLMLDWAVANIFEDAGKTRPKYTSAPNVIFAEVVNTIAPPLAAEYRESLLAQQQAAVESARQQIDQQIQAGLAAIAVTPVSA